MLETAVTATISKPDPYQKKKKKREEKREMVAGLFSKKLHVQVSILGSIIVP